MATPISNNNPAAIANNKASRSEERGSQAHGQAGGQAEQVASAQNEVAVNVSRAAEVLNQASAERGQGNIQTAEQAAAAAAQIKELFQQNPANALAGQAGGVSSDIMDLLKAG